MHAQQRRGNCCFQEKVFCFVSFFRALRGCHSRRVIFLVDNASFIETCLHNHKASIHQASAINFHDPSERAARGRRRKSARCPRKFRPGKYPGRIMYTHTLFRRRMLQRRWLPGKLLTEQRMAPSIYMTGRREKSHMPQQEPKCFPPKKTQPKMYLLLGARTVVKRKLCFSAFIMF